MARIIDQPGEGADMLKGGEVVVAYFGRVLGLFAIPKSGDRISELKGNRVDVNGKHKPIAYTSYPSLAISKLKELPNLSSVYSEVAIKNLKDLIALTSKGTNPLGFLFDAEGQTSHPWTLGKKTLFGKERTTVGLMVSTNSLPDRPYNDMIKISGHNFVLGTSANLGGDKHSRDSAHSRIGPLMKDFGEHDLHILRPSVLRILDRVRAPSTTQIYVPADEENVAYLIREGSIRHADLAKNLKKVGMKLLVPEKYIVAESYDYASRYGFGSYAKVLWTDLQFLGHSTKQKLKGASPRQTPPITS